jgi:hypothetical protein
MQFISFFQNLYYFKKTGIAFTIIFFFLPFTVTIMGSPEISLWITYGILFLVLYGIPANFFANVAIKKSILENNLGLRLVDEVNRLKKSQYDEWNKKNDIYFDTVKKYVINKLTKLNKDSIEKVKRINEKIHKLQKTIKEEKSTTNTILKRHPFIKKLKEIQNRS